MVFLDMAMAAGGSDVQYLADIVSDGTSNNIVLTVVRVILGVVQVGVIGGFAVKIGRHYMEEAKSQGGGGTKSMWEEMKTLVMAQGALAIAWPLAEFAGRLFGGVLPK